MTRTIEILENQVSGIVIWDLIDKYQATIKRKDAKWIWAFDNVLRFYLDAQEMDKLVTAIRRGELPANPLDLFEDI